MIALVAMRVLIIHMEGPVDGSPRVYLYLKAKEIFVLLDPRLVTVRVSRIGER